MIIYKNIKFSIHYGDPSITPSVLCPAIHLSTLISEISICVLPLGRETKFHSHTKITCKIVVSYFLNLCHTGITRL
jgi:hypothetical protein